MRPNSVFIFSPGPFGGAEKIVLDGARALDCPIWLIKESRNPAPCEEFEARCKLSGIYTKTFTSHRRVDLPLIRDLNEEIKNSRPKIVHSHGLKANTISSFLKTPKVATQHGKTSHDLKARVFEYIEEWRLNKVDKIICVSKNQLKDYGKNATYIENFADFELIKKTYRQTGPLNLLYVGRLSHEKGPLILIKALKDLSMPVSLTVVGDGELMEQAKELAKDIDSISFEGFQKEPSRYFENADALIMPSLREGMPLAALEAIGSGLPVLASHTGELPTLIKNNGLTFRPNDVTSLREALIAFIKNRVSINSAAKEEALMIQKVYGVENWKKKTESVYKEIIKQA